MEIQDVKKVYEGYMRRKKSPKVVDIPPEVIKKPVKGR